MIDLHAPISASVGRSDEESRPVEAAPGVLRSDAPTVTGERESLYAGRVKVYPKEAHGTFRTVKWIVMAVTLGIYYILPWIRWDRGPYLPDQAVLMDLPARRFYFFFLEIWPQEFYFVTGLLVLAALALFLVTSIAGRVWCGYTCPQTVWTDLMIAVERFWQGDRNARLKLDKHPYAFETLSKKTATHLSWLAIAVATGGAWVFYFADAPTLAKELVTFDAPVTAYLFIGIFTATTYVLGGIAREQVCIYMCPWPRIQGAMFDRDSLLISYRAWRGEPNGPHKTGESWEGRGDCIDCRQCVAVCPVGIDIRDGPQMECIQCALCIDACNEIMDKVGRPRDLIAYDTVRNLNAGADNAEPIHLIRPRVILYGVAIAVVGLIMLIALVTRPELEVNVLHDRNPLYVRLSDGGVRNGYTIKLLNKLYLPRAFSIGVEGLPDAKIDLIGHEGGAVVPVPPDNMQSVRLYVTLDKASVTALPGAATPFNFVITDIANNARTEHAVTFQGPSQGPSKGASR
ncbi:MAG TPA: cytochrome c oxidase accessory protein CcoG [Methyloceanibacter sp.]|nr:cytochrome c oxidase accessory protein CcoG [Methyloceanibacter sp.]